MTQNEFVTQYVLLSTSVGGGGLPTSRQVEEAAKLWKELRGELLKLEEPAGLYSIQWEKDELADTENGLRAVLGDFELSLDLDEDRRPRTSSWWTAGLYTAKDTDLITKTDLGVCASQEEAKEKAIEWMVTLFSVPLAIAGYRVTKEG